MWQKLIAACLPNEKSCFCFVDNAAMFIIESCLESYNTKVQSEILQLLLRSSMFMSAHTNFSLEGLPVDLVALWRKSQKHLFQVLTARMYLSCQRQLLAQDLLLVTRSSFNHWHYTLKIIWEGVMGRKWRYCHKVMVRCHKITRNAIKEKNTGEGHVLNCNCQKEDIINTKFP